MNLSKENCLVHFYLFNSHKDTVFKFEQMQFLFLKKVTSFILKIQFEMLGTNFDVAIAAQEL